MPETQVLELERHRAFQSTQKFPFNVKTAHTLKIREPHVITVTGKAFYIGHAPADHSNRRNSPRLILEHRVFSGRTIWIVDAHGYGKRFGVHADEKLTAFVELESAIRAGPVSDHVAAESREKPAPTRMDEIELER